MKPKFQLKGITKIQEFRSTELKIKIAKMTEFIPNQDSICHGLNTKKKTINVA